MSVVNNEDLKYFCAHALQGILANPFYTTQQQQIYMAQKEITIEKIAMRSALAMISIIEQTQVLLDRAASNAAEVKEATVKMVKGD